MGAEDPGPFAMLLKQYRAAAGLTQEELAEQAQLSPKAVSSLERGIRKRPHRVTVALLAGALQLGGAEKAALETAARTETGLGHTSISHPDVPYGAFLGAAPQGRMVARENELQRAASAIEAVTTGSGRLLLLTGEPGVGKTRLAQETYEMARSREFLVAAGRCYEPQSSVPYYPFLEALTAVYRSCSEDLRSTVANRWPHLRALLPDEPEFRDAPASGPYDEQILVFRAVSGFLNAVAGQCNVGLFIDDLHWADASSLQLLHHVARDACGQRILLLAACRDTETNSQSALVGMLRDLNREGLVDLIKVPRLGLEATRELISDVLGKTELSVDLGPLVHQRAEGNPYFVQQIVHALAEEFTVLSPEAVRDLGVPDTIRAVVVQRLDRLIPELREVITEAAVLGSAFEFEDLLAMSGREEDEVERAIEEATRFGLVRETGGDAYTFDHGLTQQTLYERLPARRRLRLHVSAGRAIAGLPEWQRRSRTGELAWHFLQGRDRSLGLRWSLSAGDEAWAVSAMAEAGHHYEVAAQLAQELDDRGARARAMEGLGKLFNVQARYGDSRTALEEADTLYKSLGDVVGRGRVAVELGGLYFMDGHLDEGIACVELAVTDLESSRVHIDPPSPAAELYAALGQLLWPAGRREEALAATERAGDLARRADDIRTQGWADMQRALMLEGIGRRREALETAEATLQFVTGSGFDDLVWYSLSVLTNMYSDRGDLAAAKKTIDLGLEAAHRRGDPQYIAASMAELGRYLTWVGDWDGADMQLSGAAACVGVDDPIARFIGALQARLRLWRGDTAGLDSELSTIIEASETSGNLDRLTMASILMAEYEVGEGHPDSALARLERLGTLPGVNTEDPEYIVSIARANLALNRITQTLDLLERGVARAESDGLRMALTDLRLLQARGLAALNRVPEAETAIRESMALATEMPVPFKRAQALIELSRLACLVEGRDAAQPYLAEARTIFTRLGAMGPLAQVDRMVMAQPV